METYRTKKTKCPHCGYKLDAASNIVGEGGPSEGDISICLKCQKWLVYINDYELRPIAEEEIEKLPKDILQTMIEASRAAHKVMKKEIE